MNMLETLKECDDARRSARPGGPDPDRDDPGDDGAAAAAVPARYPVHLQHRAGDHGAAGRR